MSTQLKFMQSLLNMIRGFITNLEEDSSSAARNSRFRISKLSSTCNAMVHTSFPFVRLGSRNGSVFDLVIPRASI